jgi:hypothetical protein
MAAPTREPAQRSAMPHDDDRRKFLATCGQFAAVTPPALTLLLSTSLNSEAIASSGGRRDGDRDRGDRDHGHRDWERGHRDHDDRDGGGRHDRD